MFPRGNVCKFTAFPRVRISASLHLYFVNYTIISWSFAAAKPFTVDSNPLFFLQFIGLAWLFVFHPTWTSRNHTPDKVLSKRKNCQDVFIFTLQLLGNKISTSLSRPAEIQFKCARNKIWRCTIVKGIVKEDMPRERKNDRSYQVRACRIVRAAIISDKLCKSAGMEYALWLFDTFFRASGRR